MITLTRIRQNTPFILNPDLIERVDTHVDTVVRLTSGAEYVVNETGEEIVRRTAEFRARVLALAGLIDTWSVEPAHGTAPRATGPTPAPAHGTAPEAWAPKPDGTPSAGPADEVGEVAP